MICASIRLALGSFVLLMLAGCGGAAKRETKEGSSLKPLAIAYGQFITKNQGRPPADEGEFQAHVKSLSPEFWQSFSVKDEESLFKSSRDGKPYVVIYGPVTGPPGPGGQAVMAYEQEGVGGKRYVASSLGAIEEVDDAKFRELVPNPK